MNPRERSLLRAPTLIAVAAVLIGVPLNERLLASILIRHGIAPRYVTAAESPRASWVLSGGGREIVHVGFNDGVIGPGKDLAPVTLGRRFTVEVIGEAYRGQCAYAHILGNHPGTANFSGFALQQDGDRKGFYTFAFGDGNGWQPALELPLARGRRFYLAITVDGTHVAAYSLGALIGRLETSAPLKDSDMPLTIGNWVNRDRPFHGAVYEVRLTEGVLSPEEIRRNAGGVR